MLVAVITVLVVGPKELPRVLRTVTYWVRKVRGLAGEFQKTMEDMAREADLEDIKKDMASVEHRIAGMRPEDDLNKTLDGDNKIAGMFTGNVIGTAQKAKNKDDDDEDNEESGEEKPLIEDKKAAQDEKPATGDEAGTAAAEPSGEDKEPGDDLEDGDEPAPPSRWKQKVDEEDQMLDEAFDAAGPMPLPGPIGKLPEDSPAETEDAEAPATAEQPAAALDKEAGADTEEPAAGTHEPTESPETQTTGA